MRRFVDRERELGVLAELAARATPGYLIVWAEGGLGKSSLLAELVDRRRRGDWSVAPPAVVYFFVRADGARNTSAAFHQAANAQLLELLGVSGGTPSDLGELRAQFSELWTAAAGAASAEAPLLLVVDALDEMATEPADVADVLPTSLGGHVHVVVSSRPNPDPRELVIRGHPLRSAEELVLGPFDEPSVADVLVSFEVDRPEAVDLTPRVVGLTGGEPLFTRLVGQELGGGGEAALAALERDPPADAEDYFRDQLRSLSERATGDLSWDVVGILAVAPGRIAPGELADILGARLRDVRQAVAAIDRFLLGTESVELFHRRLRDAVAREFTSAELNECRQRLLAWCRRYQAEGWPEETPPYVLDNFASLLADAGDHEALAALPDRAWMVRRRAASGSLAGFAADVATALAVLHGRGGPGPSAAEIRLALIQVTLRSIATAVPTDAIAVLARAGRTDEALGYAELADSTIRQAAAYRVVAEAGLAEGGNDDASRLLAQGLALLAPDEPDYEGLAAELRAYAGLFGNLGLTDELERAYKLAWTFEISDAAAPALGGIGVAMLEAGAAKRAIELTDELLAVEDDEEKELFAIAAAEIVGASRDASLVARLVERVEGWKLPAVLAAAAVAAGRVGDDAAAASLVDRALACTDESEPRGFSEIARTLATARPEDARAAASRALAAAMATDGFWRSYALEEVMPTLEAVGDVEGLETVRQAALGDDDCDHVLAALAGAYGRRGEAEAALAAIAAIPQGDGSYQLAALGEVVRGLVAADLVDDALAATLLITSAEKRAEARAAIALHLHETDLAERAVELAEQAIADSEQVEDEHMRSQALGSIASALEDCGAHDDALAVARETAALLATIPPEGRTGAAIGPVVKVLAAVGLVEESLAVAAENDASFLGPDVLGDLGVLLAGRGEIEEARHVADLLREDAASNEPEMRTASAVVRFAAGDRDAAVTELAAVRELLTGVPNISGLARLSRAFAAVGNADSASEAAAAAESLLAETSRDELQHMFASDAMDVATALAAAGRTEDAAALAARALDVHFAELAEWPRSTKPSVSAVPLLGPAAAAAAIERVRTAVVDPAFAEPAFPLAAVGVAYDAVDRGHEAQRSIREAIHAAALATRYDFLDVCASAAGTIAKRAGPELLLSICESLREIDSWWAAGEGP